MVKSVQNRSVHALLADIASTPVAVFKGGGVFRAEHEGGPRGWRIAIVAVTVAATLGIGTTVASAAGMRAGSPATPASSTPSPLGASVSKVGEWPSGPSAACEVVDFIGARGSGEPAGGQFHGLGAAVSKMISVVQGHLKKDHFSFATFAVNYPAASVDVLKPTAGEISEFAIGAMTGLSPAVIAAIKEYYDNQVKTYLASISAGVSAAVKKANSLHKACPSTLIVLAGYSQGAMVVHQAMGKLSGTITTCVKGALLLADGNRVPNTKAERLGTSLAKAEGIQTWITHTAHVGPTAHDVPKWSVDDSTTVNICNQSDFVCDFNFFTGVHWSRGFKVHTSYAVEKNGKFTYDPNLTKGANTVGSNVINLLTTGRGDDCR
jgi:predicted esterase